MAPSLIWAELNQDANMAPLRGRNYRDTRNLLM